MGALLTVGGSYTPAAEKVEPGAGLMLRSRIPTFERTAIIPSNQPRAGSTPRPGLAARIAAARLIEQVVDNHVALDQLTAQVGGLKEWTALEERDRGLARAIAVTGLRHRGAISAVLKTLLDRPLPKRARHLLHTLNAAAAQILYMDVPDHAAVDLAITALRNDPRSTRFVALGNALLRRIAGNKEELLENADRTGAGFPEWLSRALRSDYGRENLRRIEQAVANEPALDLTLHPRLDPDTREKVAVALQALVLPTGTVRVKSDSPVEDLPFYSEGHWWVQDAASALPARMLGDVAGLKVADLCAAPGGKTAQLAAAGALVTAVDISSARMERLSENLARLRLQAELVIADILEWSPQERFDAILLDAPCSSTGTMRRHPDVIWTKQPADIEALVRLQRQLITRASSLLKPGGRLVYANCAILKAEGEKLVAEILGSRGQPEPAAIPLRREPLASDEIPGTDGMINSAGDLRTLPFHLQTEEPAMSGMDAFFACRFNHI